MRIKLRRKLGKRSSSYCLIGAICSVLLFLLITPAVSISSNQCSSCHSNYNQQLDLVEGSSQNNIPSNIQVGQTLTVTVVLQNINNAARYTQLSSVTARLSSHNNYFTVSTPTYNVGSLSTGTATATWQITGKSVGSDQIVITVSAFNTHESISFTDIYAPSPAITITEAGSTVQPTSSPTTTMPPTSTPTINPTINPTTKPSPNPTSKPTNTPSPTPKPTSTPMPTMPTYQSTTTPIPSKDPNNNPEQINHIDELNSNLLYIHSPLSIASYVFIFLFAMLNVKSKIQTEKLNKVIGISAWILTFLGLITGMIWAQISWGSYWSWDIKETITALLFCTFTIGLITFFEGKKNVTNWLLIACCLIVIVNILNSFLVYGLHSFV